MASALTTSDGSGVGGGGEGILSRSRGQIASVLKQLFLPQNVNPQLEGNHTEASVSSR